MLKSAADRRPAALCIAQDQAEGGGATLTALLASPRGRRRRTEHGISCHRRGRPKSSVIGVKETPSLFTHCPYTRCSFTEDFIAHPYPEQAFEALSASGPTPLRTILGVHTIGMPFFLTRRPPTNLGRTHTSPSIKPLTLQQAATRARTLTHTCTCYSASY